MVELNATLIAQIINFLILVALVTKFAYKPLMQTLAERQANIAGNIEAAAQERQTAEQLKREYQKQLAAARMQAQVIVEKAEKQAKESREEILAEARAEHARLVKAAREEIARERELALAELRGEVVALTMAAATKIIGKNLDQQANAKLVADLIEKLDEQKIGGLPC